MTQSKYLTKSYREGQELFASLTRKLLTDKDGKGNKAPFITMEHANNLIREYIESTCFFKADVEEHYQNDRGFFVKTTATFTYADFSISSTEFSGVLWKELELITKDGKKIVIPFFEGAGKCQSYGKRRATCTLFSMSPGLDPDTDLAIELSRDFLVKPDTPLKDIQIALQFYSEGDNRNKKMERLCKRLIASRENNITDLKQ